MLNWLGEFAHNLGVDLFGFMLFATFAGVAVAWHAFTIRVSHLPGTPEYIDAKWRQWTVAQGLLIGWLVWAVVAAVPRPNYMVHEVTKYQKVTVTLPGLYNDVYLPCRNHRVAGVSDEKIDEMCHERALLITHPGLKIVERTQYKADPYERLFSTCVGQWAISDTETNKDGSVVGGAVIRNERIQMCHDHAMQVRHSLGIG